MESKGLKPFNWFALFNLFAQGEFSPSLKQFFFQPRLFGGNFPTKTLSSHKEADAGIIPFLLWEEL